MTTLTALFVLGPYAYPVDLKKYITAMMRALLSSSLLLLVGILFCVGFQITFHQRYYYWLDDDDSSSSPSSLSSQEALLTSLLLSPTIVEPSSSSLSKKSHQLPNTIHQQEQGSSIARHPENDGSSSTASVTQIRQPAPTCQLHNVQNRTFNRIFVLHMRKAGGSSIRSYFSQVAKVHGVEFDAAEGYKSPEQPGDDAHTLYITHVREPIARAISHYKYEKRWDCSPNMLKNKDFVPQHNNTLGMSLYNFSTTRHKMPSRLWTCASNCYARWSSGRPNYDDMVQKPQELERAAQHSLWNYNLILVSEWLQQSKNNNNNSNYVQSLEAMFGGVPGLDRKRGMPCGAQAAAANQKVPLVVQPQDVEVLQKVNQIDRRLYRDLTAYCQPQFHHHTTLRIQWNATHQRRKQRRRRAARSP